MLIALCSIRFPERSLAMKLTENGPQRSPASRHVQPVRSTDASLWSPSTVLSLIKLGCPLSTLQYMRYELSAMPSSLALNGCVPDRSEPLVGHQMLSVEVLKSVPPPPPLLVPWLTAAEKEIVSSPFPPLQSSEPASIEIRYHDDTKKRRLTAS